MLILSRKPGDSLLVNDNVEIKIVEVSGEKVKIGITAPREVKILRKELVMTVESNKESSNTATPTKLHDVLSDLKDQEQNS